MRESYRVLICGDRWWKNRAFIRHCVQMLPHGATVIHGAARGADTIAGEEAERIGLSTIRCPANWTEHGKAAGPIRNQQMLEKEPDIVWAFHNDLEVSRGTKDMVRRAKKAGIPVRIFSERLSQV